MLTALKSNRSLSFYQPTSVAGKPLISSVYSGGIASVATANVNMVTAATTTGFNNQLNGFLNLLNAEREQLAQKVAQGLSKDALYTGARQDGVSLAWDYEAADIKMGGSGSENWDAAEQKEILQNRPDTVNKTKVVDGVRSKSGGIRGAEGHHQQNVADHPEAQADPDNIKFYRSRREHLDKGHQGDWKNESNEPLTDKTQMLKDTNIKRVFRNELRGLGVAVAIGMGVGITIGFAVTLAQSGVTPESLKLALIEGAKGGAEAGIMSAVSYGIGRTIGELATKAAAGLLENLGVAITDNISKMCGMGVIGGMTIVVFSAYQFIKLKCQGLATREALSQVGKQALFSLSLLAVSIAAQGIWGGPAGIIVSVSIGIFFISYAIGTSVHQRRFAETIRVYMIDKCRPTFS
jgi:hypothetical protein